MRDVEKIVSEFKRKLRESDPKLSKEQITRRDKILNSINPKFKGYGHKMADIEKLVKEIFQSNDCSYEQATEVFKSLLKSDVHEEKFSGIYFLNHFKRQFDESTIKLFYDEFKNHCDTWALCDSTMLKVLGPFLGKKGNPALALKVLEEWTSSTNLWIKRASLVILLKIIMIRKEFDEKYVFNFVENALPDSRDYIQKGIGWLLKTCSRYEPDLIHEYLMKKKKDFPRLILRYASEKLSKEKRATVLKK